MVHGRNKESVANFRSAIPADVIFMPCIVSESLVFAKAKVALSLAFSQ
jgi:hypothetical protein